MNSLQGKTALITGSGRGLGNIMAQRLATQGANIVLHDKSWNAPQHYEEAQNLDEVIKRFEKFGIQTFAVTEILETFKQLQRYEIKSLKNLMGSTFL